MAWCRVNIFELCDAMTRMKFRFGGGGPSSVNMEYGYQAFGTPRNSLRAAFPPKHLLPEVLTTGWDLIEGIQFPLLAYLSFLTVLSEDTQLMPTP